MGFSIDAALVRLTAEKRFAADRVMTINACNIWLRMKTIICIICGAECCFHRGSSRIVVGGVDSQV
ncbi:hypothetical protein [Sphingopyxis sp. KK2]|uniref:hypothetical protein n=1 Tax=Sphingopyxis sp. KK2 TaxID=1855727 RepID=UPI001C4E1C92|nr:hypothetical protein [Sphingopyxis sp. KK2]